MISRTPLLLVALSAGAVIAACAGQPPAATTPTMNDIDGRFVWQDLMTEDVDAAMDFYGGLLGWEFEESERLGERYVLARSGGAYVAGIADVDRDDEAGAVDLWLSYLSVADVDGTVARAQDAGGRTLVAPLDLPSGRAAVVTDAQGAPLGLVQISAELSDAATQALEADTFIWRDYLADDVSAALSFYREVAGFDSERTDGTEHYVFRRGEPRAGLFSIGDEPVEPNWLAYVRVDDPAALSRRAEQLGGSVLLEARQDLRGGSLAIVADPGGAALALQAWPVPIPEDR